MSLDVVDAAFVRRLAAHARPAVRPHASPAARPRSAGIAPADPMSVAPLAAAAPERPADARPDTMPSAGAHAGRTESDSVESVLDAPIVARLLARAPEQWDALAGHCETARQRGRRVIAVAGGRAGEGRTTLLRCLASRLRSRGRDVACATPLDLAVVAGGVDGRGPTHDKRIILVDAGIWFPPGPIRRSLLQVASLGCDAAILVRRSGAPGGFTRQAALEALGIEVLGEVLTFMSPAEEDDVHDGGAAA